ncbi:alpha-L-fucosidase [Olivibacter domesticus]|uniref:alpha-L-fucosidase n=1 Tax=Olivibacter domesticus TaxID=407022 RepID=A0A1H7I2N2_OLID1|nr:alpha-L-fucosidase [Olivibacter domesticus]SEK54765.1 alpha-L-fucosidase [Olivibacter domesticus]
MKKLILSIGCCLLINTYTVVGQEHNTSANYIKPSDPLVQKNLAEWGELKFGLFMHWGTYSQWGIVESWSLCPEDEGWTQRKGPHAANYYDYVKAYENLQTQFNPTQFNPEKWAEAAKMAGMKYVVFTTKHHDGFAMFDTKQSDYKITDVKSPFSKNPRANVAKEIFTAFRKDNFKIGAYFSKPDWHTPFYWWPYFPPKDRNVNYDPKKYPDRWQKFKDFTFNQIEELMTDYGKIDILWLDGGWVRPLATVDTTVEWQRGIKTEQDIDMPRIASMARNKQPGIIVVDRTVPGEYENYVTPEQTIPEKPLDIPWESCMTMGNSFSYVPNDQYKPAREIVHNLIKIVSRGGNYLLNIAPGPTGDWDPAAYERLKEIGKWISQNGEGIYGSHAVPPYSTENIYFTQNREENTVYAFILNEANTKELPAVINIPLKESGKLEKISIIGSTDKINWKKIGKMIEIKIPKNLRKTEKDNYATLIKLEYVYL